MWKVAFNIIVVSQIRSPALHCKLHTYCNYGYCTLNSTQLVHQLATRNHFAPPHFSYCSLIVPAWIWRFAALCGECYSHTYSPTCSS